MSKSSSACGRLHCIFKRSPPFRPTATATATKKRGTLEKMVSRFKKCSESSSFRTRYDIYASTVKRLIKYNRLSVIHEILDHQKNFPDITSETFTAHLIYLYGKAGMFDHARKLFDEMPELKCPRTVFSFNALLLACINSRRFDEIKKLIADLRCELGITFDVVSYSIAINGFCRMGDLESAEMVFDEMIKRDVEPNLITFNTLLNGFYLNGKFVDGERIWSRMMEMNAVPDVRSYNAKLHGLAMEKRMKEAIEVVEEMRDKGFKLDVFSFNALIRGFIYVEDLEEAKQWYGEMRRLGCAPNRVTFKLLIPFLCEKGDVGFADEEKLILYEKNEVTDYELIPGGRNIKVTEENKHQYVDLVAEHRLTTAIRPQINAFLEGFNELISRELISIFNDKELELLISGLPDIDLDDMRANTEYSGYSPASPVIQWFWEVVQGFSKEDKARLLQFVTGTSKVPLEGFSALQGISGSQKFQIHKAYGSPDHLPSAHTCFNQLDLPEYPSKQHLEERLLLAIHEASEGFGFG